MATQVKKTITADTRLKAFALFTMAHDHYQRAREFEQAVADLLDVEDGPYCGCISDEMCDGGNFDRGLKNEGFVVAPTPKKAKR